MGKDIFDVVGALLENKGKYLVCKRKKDDQYGSMWEFPGGRVEPGENKISAVKREIKEELDIEISIEKVLNVFEDENDTMKIFVYLYNGTIKNGTPSCIECDEVKWATPDEIKTLNLAPADKKIAEYLLTHHK